VPGFPEVDCVKLDHHGIDIVNKKVRLCKTCSSTLRKGNLPACSLANSNVLGDIPEALQNLKLNRD
jgi:hypothetical protein